MLSSVLTAALLALQAPQSVLAGPIHAPDLQRRDDRRPTPSKSEVEDMMEPWNDYGIEHVFYTLTQTEAKKWANDHFDDFSRITIWDTDEDLQNGPIWEDYGEVQNLWVEVYTEQAQGVAWVMYVDGSKIPSNSESAYDNIEKPILERNAKDDGNALFEVIQVSAANTNEIYQILPVDVRDFSGCSWHGEAPNCDAQCPDGTNEITRSHYGDDPNGKCTGHGKKVFCCPA
ncbi:hypothetical protein BFW01_g11732 [Lasiodiplodia theobromae]|nr:hypothetical protein BFW01_g11732 [Lasiodiplodia theobromae]